MTSAKSDVGHLIEDAPARLNVRRGQGQRSDHPTCGTPYHNYSADITRLGPYTYYQNSRVNESHTLTMVEMEKKQAS